MTQDPTGTRPAPSGRESEVVSDLRDLADLPVAEHAARFDAVHDRLRARLDQDDETTSPEAGDADRTGR
ncbi:hypothetical protein [Isoptericola chiayiensis]|nr:hypothetical protein [Isoptericola chiayiensis]NOV99717.1 hypothetical protein [Isoptericola chiayiensis]